MPTYTCETCKNEFTSARKHPYCCYECFLAHYTHRSQKAAALWDRFESGDLKDIYEENKARLLLATECTASFYDQTTKNLLCKGAFRDFADAGVFNAVQFLNFVNSNIRMKKSPP